MTNRPKDELLALLEQVKGLVEAEPAAQQVIVVKTAKGNVYHVSNRDVESGADEDGLLRQLRDGEHTQIQAVVCIWQEGGALDVPSIRFRQQLLELDPRNGDALLPLQGENVLVARTLRETMPGK